MKVTQICTLDPRPEDVPANWVVFNAPRPPYGHKDWQGTFRHGIFYSAIDPAQPEAQRLAAMNRDYDCWVMRYMTREQVMAEARAYYSQHGVDVDQHDFQTVWSGYVNRFGKLEVELEFVNV